MRKFLACFGIVVLCVFGAMLLGACGNSISSGRVISKHYAPGHEQSYEQPISHTQCETEDINGEDEDECNTYYTYLWRQRYVAPSWQIELQNGHTTGWVTVTQQQYGQFSKGDYYGRHKQ